MLICYLWSGLQSVLVGQMRGSLLFDLLQSKWACTASRLDWDSACQINQLNHTSPSYPDQWMIPLRVSQYFLML